jgi:drug/metabolite transporter (DMT)-like permease
MSTDENLQIASAVEENSLRKIISTKTAYLMMLISTMIWGGTFAASQVALGSIPLYSLVFLRFAAGGLVLFLVMKNRKIDMSFDKRHIPQYLFVGLVFMLGYHALFFTALRYTSALNGAIIGATPPILVALFFTIFFRQRLHRYQLIGISVSFVGVFLTITNADWMIIRTFQFNIGDIIMVIAMSINALYQIYCRKRCQGISPFILMYYGIAVCLIALIPFVLYERPWEFLPHVPPLAWGSIVYLGLLSTAVAYVSQQMSIQSIGVENTAVMCNLVPIFAFLFSVFCLGEPFQPIKLLTAIIIIGGVVICQKRGEFKKD